MDPIKIVDARAHILWSVDWQLDDLKKKMNRLQIMWSTGGPLKKWWAVAGLLWLRARAAWWDEIKKAIESNDSNQALPAIERLINHYRPSKFFLTYIAPFSTTYWEFGMGFIAKSAVSELQQEALTLRDHYRAKVAQ